MKNLLIIFFLTSLSGFSWAQNDLIRIQSIGTGPTEAEAITDAQINALKRSYQTFLSSDLTVLNNQIVKDEIASLVSGTIKEFKILSTFQGDLGLWQASIDAVLSQDSLINFAEGIGDEINVQGSIFGAEIKQQNLNRDNEFISVEHLIKKARFFEDFYDIELTENIAINEIPSSTGVSMWETTFGAKISANNNFFQLYKLTKNTLDAISMSQIEIEKYNKMGRRTFTFRICHTPRYYVYKEYPDYFEQSPYTRYTGAFRENAGVLDKKKRKNRKEKKRDKQECRDYILRNIQSIIVLHGLEEIVRKDLEDYAIYYIDPLIADKLYNRPGLSFYNVAGQSVNSIKVKSEKKFHPINRLWNRNDDDHRRFIYDCGERFPSREIDRSGCTVIDENTGIIKPRRFIIASCEGIGFYNGVNATIVTFPCWKRLKIQTEINGYRDFRRYLSPSLEQMRKKNGYVEEQNPYEEKVTNGEPFSVPIAVALAKKVEGVHQLIFPAKNDLILELVIAHKMNQDTLSSLTGYKTSTASEVRKRREERQQRKELEDKKKEQRRLKLEVEKLEAKRIKKSKIKKIDQAKNKNESFLDRITDIFK